MHYVTKSSLNDIQEVNRKSVKNCDYLNCANIAKYFEINSIAKHKSDLTSCLKISSSNISSLQKFLQKYAETKVLLQVEETQMNLDRSKSVKLKN